jgi:hypothetical protein
MPLNPKRKMLFMETFGDKKQRVSKEKSLPTAVKLQPPEQTEQHAMQSFRPWMKPVIKQVGNSWERTIGNPCHVPTAAARHDAYQNAFLGLALGKLDHTPMNPCHAARQSPAFPDIVLQTLFNAHAPYAHMDTQVPAVVDVEAAAAEATAPEATIEPVDEVKADEDAFAAWENMEAVALLLQLKSGFGP